MDFPRCYYHFLRFSVIILVTLLKHLFIIIVTLVTLLGTNGIEMEDMLLSIKDFIV